MLSPNATTTLPLVTVLALLAGCDDVDPSAPSVSATVSPMSAEPGDTLLCDSDASDADGDLDGVTYLWSTGETEQTIVVGDDAEDGQAITCTATATDAGGRSATDTAAAIVRVERHAPTVSVAVSPSVPEPGDTLLCEDNAADADGDLVSVEYQWSTGGSAQTTTVSADAEDGQTITCTVTATDAAGQSTTDTAIAVVNIEVIEEDPVCGSLYFDGSTLVQVDPSASFPSGNEPRTVMLWARAESRSVVNLLTFGSGMAANSRYSVLLEPDHLKVVGENHDYWFDDSVGEDWIHVAVTYDGATLSLFEDGELIDAQAVSSAFATDNSFEMIIGSNSLDRDDEFFEGYISDVRVWSRSLSEREVEDEFESLFTEASPQQLVGHWPLNDSSGMVAADISGNSLDGLLTGGDWDSDCP